MSGIKASGSARLLGLLLAPFAGMLGLAACGLSENDVAPLPVAIPSVTIECGTTEGKACDNMVLESREVVAFWTYGDCDVEKINRGEFVVQGASVFLTASDCDFTKQLCTETIATWHPFNDTEKEVTTIPTGKYQLCTFVNTNTDNDLGESGDARSQKSGIALNSATATETQTVSEFTLLK